MKKIETELAIKPFDLTKALAGEPCGKRNGKEKVHSISYLKGTDLTYPVHVVFESELDLVHEYTMKGEFCQSEQGDNDLIMLTPKKIIHIAIIRLFSGSYETMNRLFESEEEAQEFCDKEQIRLVRTVPIEVPE
jgi:hypothetical protein